MGNEFSLNASRDVMTPSVAAASRGGGRLFKVRARKCELIDLTQVPRQRDAA